MLTEIIRGLTKSDENTLLLSEHVLIWAKRIEAQRAQVAVINSSHGLKSLDAILQIDEGKQRETKPSTPVKILTRRRCKYCSQVKNQGGVQHMGRSVKKCDKMNHLKRYAEVPKGVQSIT